MFPDQNDNLNPNPNPNPNLSPDLDSSASPDSGAKLDQAPAFGSSINSAPSPNPTLDPAQSSEPKKIKTAEEWIKEAQAKISQGNLNQSGLNQPSAGLNQATFGTDQKNAPIKKKKSKKNRIFLGLAVVLFALALRFAPVSIHRNYYKLDRSLVGILDHMKDAIEKIEDAVENESRTQAEVAELANFVEGKSVEIKAELDDLEKSLVPKLDSKTKALFSELKESYPAYEELMAFFLDSYDIMLNSIPAGDDSLAEVDGYIHKLEQLNNLRTDRGKEARQVTIQNYQDILELKSQLGAGSISQENYDLKIKSKKTLLEWKLESITQHVTDQNAFLENLAELRMYLKRKIEN